MEIEKLPKLSVGYSIDNDQLFLCKEGCVERVFLPQPLTKQINELINQTDGS